ncbi:hypothetical protein BDK51DRAFT_28115 [Blyttiomyces helicus]|uniref:U6 snRNA phosphodiesterase 1 n=1 Tax=Blyttiomyces helicus TaxID=388810 RepID=A0A4V1IRE2_9FUNG|nr:hypothetical protein BDK51DRAFT_28115 [Blyttiomyces helicus]|eukprot:RKO89747.1 hypothetical protein BDK51DRAFT_28115 [Blyttiomyces helicus]
MQLPYDSSDDGDDHHQDPESGGPAGPSKRPRSPERETDPVARKRQAGPKPKLLPPPLPDDFLNLFEGKDKGPRDDPALNAGRTRTVPHIVGNWATFVHVRVIPPPELADHIARMIDCAREKVPSILPTDLLDGGYHVSLSRSVSLKVFQIDSFVDLVKEVVENRMRFDLGFSGVSNFANDEGTRSFLAIDVGAGRTELEGLLADIDGVLAKFRLPKFYETPRFHASIAWAHNEDIGSEVVEHVRRSVEDCGDGLRVPIASVQCRRHAEEVIRGAWKRYHGFPDQDLPGTPGTPGSGP